jgi:hypothetical protein
MTATRVLNAIETTTFEANALAEALDALHDMDVACSACVDACVQGRDGTMSDCIGACLTCIDVETALARLLARTASSDLAVVRNMLEAAAKAATFCAEVCEPHGERHKHCRVCAEGCRRVQQALQHLLVEAAA